MRERAKADARGIWQCNARMGGCGENDVNTTNVVGEDTFAPSCTQALSEGGRIRKGPSSETVSALSAGLPPQAIIWSGKGQWVGRFQPLPSLDATLRKVGDNSLRLYCQVTRRRPF
eukprot:6068823-Pleurochrysis_carterae.AAC.2